MSPSSPGHEARTLAEALVEQSIVHADRIATTLLDRPDLVIPFIEALSALDDPHDCDDRTPLVRAVLGAPGPDALALAVTITATAPQSVPRPGGAFCTFPYQRDALVGQLVALRPAADLVRLVIDRAGGAADADTSLRILHHLVALGHTVPDAAHWPIRWAVDTGHPLAALPADLSDVERHVPGFSGPSADLPLDTGWAYPTARCALGDRIPGFGDRLPVDAGTVSAAVRDWPLLSNGEVHVGSWRPGPGEHPPDAHLDRGRRAHRGVRLTDEATPLLADVAFVAIFAAARNGPAYGGTPGPGAARLRAWETVAGMVGMPWPSPIAAVAEAARTTSWSGLSGSWIWQLRLLAARHDRLVLLDAHDID